MTVVDLGEHRLKDLGRREHVFELRFPGQPVEFPPLRSLGNPQLRHNLPEQWSSFIGRHSELAELDDLFTQHRLVTLVGPGGTGKTRLALQAIAERVDSVPDGVWLVELAPVNTSNNVGSAVADTLGVREHPGRPRLVSIVEALEDRRLVVLLDNCEHVIEAAAEIVDTLLRRCAGVTVVATSREPLQIDGEQLFHVAALPTPSDTTSVDQSDAVRLLVDRAQHHNQDFTLHDEDPAIVASLVQRLDGIPLAIELAAARLGSMSLTDIHERLDQRFRLLDGGSRTALPRQRTLRALIDWSYELLSIDEQLVLQRLTVFPSTWTLAAAEAIVSDERVSRADVASVHDSLVAKNLVQRVDTITGTRYRLLDTVRAYAMDKLLADSVSTTTCYERDTWTPTSRSAGRRSGRMRPPTIRLGSNSTISGRHSAPRCRWTTPTTTCSWRWPRTAVWRTTTPASSRRFRYCWPVLTARSHVRSFEPNSLSRFSSGLHRRRLGDRAHSECCRRRPPIGRSRIAGPHPDSAIPTSSSLRGRGECVDGIRIGGVHCCRSLGKSPCPQEHRRARSASWRSGSSATSMMPGRGCSPRSTQARTLNDPTFISTDLLDLAELQLIAGEWSEAASCSVEAQQLAETHHLHWIEAMAELDLGLIAEHDGDPDEADSPFSTRRSRHSTNSGSPAWPATRCSISPVSLPLSTRTSTRQP